MSDSLLLPARKRDYSHSYWANSWRRNPDDYSPDLLCFESGYYGLIFNTADLTWAQFKLLDDDLSYIDVMSFENRGRMEGLDEMELVIEVMVDGKTYRAQSARPVNEEIGLCNGRLWEAGRVAQHYELVGIIFEDINAPGEQFELPCNASLYIVAWPEEFAITLSTKCLMPPDDELWQKGATVRLRLGDWTTIQPFTDGPWSADKGQTVTIACSVNGLHNAYSGLLQDDVTIGVENKGAGTTQTFDVTYDVHYSCFVVNIESPHRNFEIGYTDIRDADVFGVQIENKSDEIIYVPVMFYLLSPANITGLVPMLWVPQDADDASQYVPSGIPIQNSKNWHYIRIGNYLKAYTLIPSKPGLQHLEFRVYYGFYGQLCSASHANLCLMGYTKYDGFHSTGGRWEQLSIGCFGETMCFDVEYCLTNVTITDVRALMVRDEKEWGWTNGGWGGDWLCLYDDAGRKLLLGGVKVGYVSQGPCLTEVKYVAYYGSNAAVHLEATVWTFRTNDYARTVQRLQYNFTSTVAITNEPGTDGSCLFRVGGSASWEGWFCRKIALGNGDGLIEEIEVPSTLSVGDYIVDKMKMAGPGPWWIAFPDSGFKSHQKGMGIAWKALIIRNYKSTIAGVIRYPPKISLYVRQDHGDGDFYVDAMVVPNLGITQFSQGDEVSFDVEWVTFPYSSDTYYGDNASFKQHLQDNPMSWKTAFREAAGNNLGVSVTGGGVINTYPLIIGVSDAVVNVSIFGGVGAVPVRFEGLDSRNYRLTDDSAPDLSVQWYETSFSPEKQTYSLVFNLPLDDRTETSWTLTQDAECHDDWVILDSIDDW